MHSVAIAFLYSIMVSSLLAQTQPTPDATTGIEGVITASPIHGGPARIGVPDSRPLANTDFVIQNDKGVVTSFTTDTQGQFRVSLAPGHYTVSLKERRGGIGRYGPFGVDVIAGQMTKVAWQCDTGMR
jgi:Prealbumin-like fold domain